jgi:glycosyltransferase involved in cell wall biosynthesis
MIVPLNLGSGTRLKILEGMSLKKCIVSTAKGAEGIMAENNKDIIIADSAKEFSERVIDCLTNKSLVETIETNARKMVVSTYDWEVIGLDLLSVYKKLLINK